jgi:predicted lipase
MQGYVAYSPGNKAIIVAFRGSDNTKNWIDDFDFLQIAYVRCAGCLMHNGFYLAYLSIASKMKAQIEFLLQKYRGSPIYVTGHSLGGALATVAAIDIKHVYNPSSMKVYTFGQPRVGNSLYSAHFAK